VDGITVGGFAMKAWTDYPIVELGDIPGKIAPIREVFITGYDGDKYADVIVEGVKTSFKAAYLYETPGRCGDVPMIDRRKLHSLIEG